MKLPAGRKWILFVLVTVAGLFLDWLTKWLVVETCVPGVPVSLVGSFLEVLLVFNRGGLFGIDPRGWLPGFPVNWFFYVFSAAAVVLLVVYYRNLRRSRWPMYLGISLIMPGALGNLLDRVLHPDRGVVDFVKCDLGFWPFNPWPIWNLADAYITVGVVLILSELVREELSRKPAAGPAEDPGGP
ncbi:MAG: signal peptidase II [Chitinivibrionales bacterium]|nr:signal peptidase II [Chitinivibrionales bacterium]MBD3397160.1 signal peptidase II [Chitinivibrionales bacterium]